MDAITRRVEAAELHPPPIMAHATVGGNSPSAAAGAHGGFKDPRYAKKRSLPDSNLKGQRSPLNLKGQMSLANFKGVQNEGSKKNADPSQTQTGLNSVDLLPHLAPVEIAHIWRLVNGWSQQGGGRQFWPKAYHNWTAVIAAVSQAKILRAGVPKKGVQVKAFIELQGGMKGYVKPKRYDNTFTVHGRPYDGCDRHSAEIAAFHLARLMGLRRVPVTVGRRLDARLELFKVADAALLDSFFTEPETERLCFYRRGKCAYCHKGWSACTEPGSSTMEVSISLQVPTPLREYRHPWARTYKDDLQAPWEKDPGFCTLVAAHELYGQAPLFLDLIDTAVFDYLMGNADRHRFEMTVPDPSSGLKGMLVLLDNGKGFRSPEHDEMTILAPLYQCCRLRRSLYDVLHYFAGAEMNMGAALDASLTSDPTFPVLPLSYLRAVNRRLVNVLTLVEICIERHGRGVLQDDGYR